MAESELEAKYEKRRRPLWVVICYLIFVPFLVFAMARLSWRMLQQFRIGDAIHVLMYCTDHSEAEIERAKEIVKKQPDLGMLFLVQQLQQDADRDERMARAFALRRVMEWSRISTYRVLLGKLYDNMEFNGAVKPGFALNATEFRELHDLIVARNAAADAGYEERKITEVLAWVEAVLVERMLHEAVAEDEDLSAALKAGKKPSTAGQARVERFVSELKYDGVTKDSVLKLFNREWPGEPKGFERVRVRRLLDNYEKKQLRGSERAGLQQVILDWQKSDVAGRKNMVPKLQKVVAGQPASFTAEEVEVCRTSADKLEDQYRKGCIEVARTLREIVVVLAAAHKRVSHPVLYEFTVLLGYKYPEVRDVVSEIIYDLRYHKHVILFLSNQALRSKINPVMAVETAKLTKEEHERILRAENTRRRLAAMELLGRVEIRFCQKPFTLLTARGNEVSIERAKEIMEFNCMRTLQALREDPSVRAEATRILDAIKRTCQDAGK